MSQPSSPDRQLHDELDTSLVQVIKTGRPILTHLNADTSWLIQIPWPETAANPSGRYFYNILLDPWFKGSQSDVARFFSTQEHLIASSVQTIDELNDNLAAIQHAAVRAFGSRTSSKSKRKSSTASTSFIDVMAISHEFTDHCHQATLLELHPSVPVFATEKAADLIRSWKHFETVITTPAFAASDPDWTKTSLSPLPSFIGISRIVTAGNALYYHSAIMITFAGSSQGSHSANDAAEAMIYSPHGIVASDLTHLTNAKPPIHTLALLHGLHDVGISWTKQLNLGGHNGLQAQRICKARYWVGTHDEIKKPGGFIAPFLRRTVISVQEALEKEKMAHDGEVKEDMLIEMQDVDFRDLGSGESLLLE